MCSAFPLRIASQDKAGTRLGRVRLTAFIDDGQACITRPRRVLNYFTLVLVHDGRGLYVDNTSTERLIEPGDTIIVVPGHPHWYGPPPGGRWSEIFIEFDGPVFDLLAINGVLDVRDPLRRVAPLGAWYQRLCEFADRPRRSRAVERELEVLELAELLVELRSDAEDAEPVPESVRRARELLAADLAADLDLHDVAARSGLSYETFRKVFRAETGTSPAAFRLDRRIEVAQTLLRTTTMTHAAIAGTLGFADERHFAKRFRDRTGISPWSYRRMNTTKRGL